jgi:hypothetical protein
MADAAMRREGNAIASCCSGREWGLTGSRRPIELAAAFFTRYALHFFLAGAAACGGLYRRSNQLR